MPSTVNSEKSSKKGSFIHSFFEWMDNSITYEYDRTTLSKSGNIIAFNAVYAVFFSALIPRRGSVFNAFELMVIFGISGGVTFVLGYFSCMDNISNKNCISLPPPNTSYLTLLSLCSFLISHLANSIVQRWWSIRTHFSNLQGKSKDVIMLYGHTLARATNQYRDTPEYNEKLAYSRRCLKHCIGLLLLIYCLAMSGSKKEKGILDLYQRRLISKKEYVYFSSLDALPSDVCSALVHLILASMGPFSLFSYNDIYFGSGLLECVDNVLAMRSDATNINLIVNVQLPLPFIIVTSSLIYFFSFQLFIVSASFVSYGLSIDNVSYCIIGILTSSLFNFVLWGFCRLFTILSNPCGHDAADFPLRTHFYSLEYYLQQTADNIFESFECMTSDKDEFLSPSASPENQKDERDTEEIEFGVNVAVLL